MVHLKLLDLVVAVQELELERLQLVAQHFLGPLALRRKLLERLDLLFGREKLIVELVVADGGRWRVSTGDAQDAMAYPSSRFFISSSRRRSVLVSSSMRP